MSKKALVLSGGSIKGCYQAGAIKAVLDSGFIPDVIYGISVGALNGAFIYNKASNIYKNANKAPLIAEDWKDVGSALESFWKEEITKAN